MSPPIFRPLANRCLGGAGAVPLWQPRPRGVPLPRGQVRRPLGRPQRRRRVTPPWPRDVRVLRAPDDARLLAAVLASEAEVAGSSPCMPLVHWPDLDAGPRRRRLALRVALVSWACRSPIAGTSAGNDPTRLARTADRPCRALLAWQPAMQARPASDGICRRHRVVALHAPCRACSASVVCGQCKAVCGNGTCSVARQEQTNSLRAMEAMCMDSTGSNREGWRRRGAAPHRGMGASHPQFVEWTPQLERPCGLCWRSPRAWQPGGQAHMPRSNKKSARVRMAMVDSGQWASMMLCCG